LAGTETQARTLRPDDLFQFALPGDPQLSPDGRTVVFVVQTFDREQNTRETRLFTVSADGRGQPRPLTAGPKDRLPRWSPDGRRLAFVSERSGKPQLYILDREGGEAWVLPTRQKVESAPVWSPDGRYLAFVARAWAKSADWVPYPGAPKGDAARAREQAARRLEGQQQAAKKPVSDVKVITDLRFRFDGVGYFGDLKKQVFVVEVPPAGPGPGEQREEVEARQVTSGDFDHDFPTWSPDGTRIACVAFREELTWENLSRQDLWVFDVETGAARQLIDGAGPIFSPVWSPDGRYIAFIGHDLSYGLSTTNALWLAPTDPVAVPLQFGDCICLTRHLDRPVGATISSDLRYLPFRLISPQWAGERLYFTVADRGAAGLFACRVSDQVAEGATPGIAPVVPAAGRSVAGFSVSQSGVIVFQAGDAAAPDDLYLRTPTGEERRLTAVNAAWLREVQLGAVEKFSYRGADGWPMEGWLIKPPGFEAGRAYPTVLFIHGGPHGVYGEAFMLQMQLVAAQGMVVVYTNPRGSQTYGQEFAYAVVADWGGKDYEDIMAGVEAVIRRGIADPERLGVTGWSYGGYMTNWVITQTDRFKAAVSGACVSNRHNFYGTSDIGFTFGEHHWRGRPWDEPERLLARSPLMYVENVQTPLLLVHGEADLRCPVEQADQMYIALKRLGKEVVYVRYPDEFHSFRQPLHQLDRYERLVSWFVHYLQPQC